MQGTSITIGTRGSELALRQVHLVSEWLGVRLPGLEIEVRTIKTEADRLSERPIAALGDKGVFVRAIEQELLDGSIDLAVHSLKDVPADVETPGLVLAALLGVNIGPNLSYVGSLATLLWRRVLASRAAAPTLGEFSRLGALTVPACLAAATTALWLGVTLGPGWLP